MSVELNHTIVRAHDKQETARHLVEILGLPEPTTFGPFVVVQVANGVSLDVAAIHGRIRERGLDWWADPFHRRPGEVNHDDGGRGLYWLDPNGHSLEIITVPYGGGSA